MFVNLHVLSYDAIYLYYVDYLFIHLKLFIENIVPWVFFLIMSSPKVERKLLQGRSVHPMEDRLRKLCIDNVTSNSKEKLIITKDMGK